MGVKNAPLPIFSVVYNGKNISESINKYLISCSFEDTEEGESSSVEIELENVDGLWSNGWYPDKGAMISVKIDEMDCGNFEIDEIELKGPPDTVSIKALANIPTEKPLHTKRSKAHEKKSLRQIAEAVAKNNGLTLVGTVPNIMLERVTQKRETDLKFLRKISWQYGIIFSVRDKKLVYTSVVDLDKRAPAFSLDKTDLTDYSVKDKTSGIFREAVVKWHDPRKRKLVSYRATAATTETVSNKDDITYKIITSANTLSLHHRVENSQQAEAVAKAVLYRMNGQEQTGNFEFRGNRYALAGNNMEVCGLGKAASGVFHIGKASHTIDRSGSWKVKVDVKRVSVVSKVKQRSVKAKQPAFKNTTTGTIPQTNKDGINYNLIK